MVWLNIAQMVLALAVKIMSYLDKKQLVDAGRDKERLRALQEAKNEVKKARAARKSVKYSSDELRKDPHNRDENDL